MLRTKETRDALMHQKNVESAQRGISQRDAARRSLVYFAHSWKGRLNVKLLESAFFMALSTLRWKYTSCELCTMNKIEKNYEETLDLLFVFAKSYPFSLGRRQQTWTRLMRRWESFWVNKDTGFSVNWGVILFLFYVNFSKLGFFSSCYS